MESTQIYTIVATHCHPYSDDGVTGGRIQLKHVFNELDAIQGALEILANISKDFSWILDSGIDIVDPVCEPEKTSIEDCNDWKKLKKIWKTYVDFWQYCIALEPNYYNAGFNVQLSVTSTTFETRTITTICDYVY